MTPPLKILHCLGTLNPGGVETWLLNLSRNLDIANFQFNFCTFGADAGLYAPALVQLGSRIYRCPRHPSSTLAHRFRKILGQGNYDVVHSHVHFFSGALLRWAALEGVPTRIAQSHSTHDGKPDSLGRKAYRRLMSNWIQQYATHGLAASRQAAANLFTASWQHDPRIAILHYGIDLQSFRAASNENPPHRDRIPVPDGAPVVAHVGNFVTPKNHTFLLDVAAQITKRRSDIHFLLIGDGPLRVPMQTRARSLSLENNVHFLGTRTDVPHLLRQCDAFLFPSLWEGLPAAVIEAQASGLPCVISSEITDEVAILPHQVIPLPLSAGPKKWAEATIDALHRGKLDPHTCINALEDSDFSIHHSLSRLLTLYSNSNQLVHARAASR
jgi:glycosyltransferase involved in cell wall biosynthesis